MLKGKNKAGKGALHKIVSANYFQAAAPSSYTRRRGSNVVFNPRSSLYRLA
jgi:hypothetical protein